jgi:hypothetical protein
MTSDLVDLARRAIACPRWRWLPGMLGWRTGHYGEPVRVRFVESVESQELLDPRIYERNPSKISCMPLGHAVVDGWMEVSTILPDLADPATLGGLLALVREAWYGLHMSLDCRLVACDKWEWTITGFVDPKIIPFYAFRGRGPSQAEALVSALEAAP